MNHKPISTGANNNSNWGCAIALGGLFFLVGSTFLWFIALSPLIKSQTSDHWQETPCKIIASKVKVDHDDDGPSYRPKVEFEFNVDGQQFVSDTYDFTELNRTRSRCQEIVAKHPAGMKASCFVNPDDPQEAVIVRDYDFSWFGLLFPLIFALVGLAVMLSPLYAGKKSKSKSISGRKRSMGPATSQFAATNQNLATDSAATQQHPGDIEDQLWDEPQNLKPKQSRVAGLIVILLFAIFWNAIISGLILQVINKFEILSFLFMLPFAAVGLGLIGGVFFTLAKLLNPTVELALSAGAVRRGASVDVAWQLKGRTSKLRSLTVKIEGKESATYQRGTNTHTDHHVFCTIPVTEVTNQEEIGFGSCAVEIPAETMHTFSARRNEIVWTVAVHGVFPFWPDIKETFDFRVMP